MFTQIDRPEKHLTAQMHVSITQERVKGHVPESAIKDFYQTEKLPKGRSLQLRPAKINLKIKFKLSALLYNMHQGLKQNQVFTYETRSNWSCTVFIRHLLQKSLIYRNNEFHQVNPQSSFCTNKNVYFTRSDGYSAYSLPDSVEESTELSLPESPPILKSNTYENSASHFLNE